MSFCRFQVFNYSNAKLQLYRNQIRGQKSSFETRTSLKCFMTHLLHGYNLFRFSKQKFAGNSRKCLNSSRPSPSTPQNLMIKIICLLTPLILMIFSIAGISLSMCVMFKFVIFPCIKSGMQRCCTKGKECQ